MLAKPSSSESLIYTRWRRGHNDGMLVRYVPGTLSNAVPFLCIIRGQVQAEEFRCGSVGNFRRPRVPSLDGTCFTLGVKASQNAKYAAAFYDTLDGLYHVRSRINLDLPIRGMLQHSQNGGPYLVFEHPVLNYRNDLRGLNVVDSAWKRVDSGTVISRLNNANVDVCVTLHYTQAPESSVSMFDRVGEGERTLD
ncbi:hypothetical protein BDN72DRAFT_865534 [Pluteus cervinus]|uniref:Uncharacterized protein n=1 Tax=Pluteus cervinus TaxID=181527 RepID=A0ACD2ZZS9_9AGAR|nr:hypothetical protein BDN72DRAFT_865534 [Pluteus cervinus]